MGSLKNLLVSLVFLFGGLNTSYALKPVNLLKNSGFEKFGYWQEKHNRSSGVENKAVICKQDSSQVYEGNYSASIDTRKEPPSASHNTGYWSGLEQKLILPKNISDLDSLSWYHYVVYKDEDFEKSIAFQVVLFGPKENNNYADSIFYVFARSPPWISAPDNEHKKIFTLEMPDDSIWFNESRNLKKDLIENKHMNPETKIEYVRIENVGIMYYYEWLAQKVFYDNVKLKGFADYNASLVRVISSDKVEPEVPYIPEVMVWNNGKKDQEIKVKAEIKNDSEIVYEDSAILNFLSDESTSIKFKPFNPEKQGIYDLTFKTGNLVNMLDECSEDDSLSKKISYVGISDKELNKKFLVSPNPFYSSTKISYEGNKIISIYDIAGRVIFSASLKNGSYLWHGKDKYGKKISPGIYFIKCENYIKKIIKLNY